MDRRGGVTLGEEILESRSSRHGRRINQGSSELARTRKERLVVEHRALPTVERLRRAGADFERGDTGQITMRDSPLERSFARGVITQEQYAAGQKYRHHWYHAGLSDRLGSADLNRIFATDLNNFSGMPKTEVQVFHRQRYREAAQAAGKIGSHVLDWAVCREVQLEQVG
jgi:hypothetical protein